MELTVQNLYDALLSQEIDQKILEYDESAKRLPFNTTDYHSIIFTLLNEFYPEFKIKPFNVDDQRPLVGGLTYLNEKCQKKICCNITKLQFNSFYPNIIIKLLEIGKDYSYEPVDHSDIDPFFEETWENKIIDGLVCNIPEFGELYKFIVENKKEMKKFEDKFIDNLLKVIINYTYGVFANKYSKIRVREVENITNVGRDIINIFITSYPNNVISADTDEINFLDFDSIKEDVEKKLKELEYPYEYEEYLYGVFVEKKSFILSNDKDMKIRGLRKISKLEPPKGSLYPRGALAGIEIVDHIDLTGEFAPIPNIRERYLPNPRIFITE